MKILAGKIKVNINRNVKMRRNFQKFSGMEKLTNVSFVLTVKERITGDVKSSLVLT